MDQAYPLIQALAEDVAPILLATRISYRRPVTISDALVGRIGWRGSAEFDGGSPPNSPSRNMVHAEAEQEGLFMRLSTRRPIAIPERSGAGTRDDRAAQPMALALAEAEKAGRAARCR